ncbi:hypothetical protein KOR34_30500 [Posidoniimonas corsicana]|uniref:DUF7691 domain-containing protein n=1 Tax=Posidoniimonas corsicana TaxID=1938618 RepID=A0A5C5VK40_9BACT|nr:hypothetical protein [Posidoniimonas corsicana]TWT38082.1 hypothetical protein KOR34_30500 [Posidoniimonas corsicana]
MSYALSACVVDADQLTRMVGCGDESVVQQVMEADPEAFDYEPDDDELSVAQALRHLVMGEPTQPDDAHQYGYALQALCNHAGETILPDVWGGVRWAAVEDCGLEDLLTQTGPPIALPENDDFPAIGHLKRSELDAALKAARKRRDKVLDEDLEDLLDEFIDWLEAARSAHLDVVFFYH